MTSSSGDSDLLDLERGLPTTAADVLALRRVRRSRQLSTEDYLRALTRLLALQPQPRRARRQVHGGTPFRLVD
jgi:hypothetical protein